MVVSPGLFLMKLRKPSSAIKSGSLICPTTYPTKALPAWKLWREEATLPFGRLPIPEFCRAAGSRLRPWFPYYVGLAGAP
jgi:hypothetical protein